MLRTMTPQIGKVQAMKSFRRITVTVPARDLEGAQALTGKGLSETVRIAIRYQNYVLSRQKQKAVDQLAPSLSIDDFLSK
jgi:hypothetical protein